jgi:hypothetical protein
MSKRTRRRYRTRDVGAAELASGGPHAVLARMRANGYSYPRRLLPRRLIGSYA